MKRDIAYHGDTVNTASRIQGLCSFLNKNFLVSKTFHELIIDQEGFFTESIGTYLLKGKETAVEIYSIAAGADQLTAFYSHGDAVDIERQTPG